MHACIHSSLSRLFIFPTTNSICVCVGDAWQVRRPDTNFYEPTYEPPPHRNQKRTAPSMNSPPTAAILVSSPAQLWRVFLAAQVGVSAHAVVLASTRCCVSLAHAEWVPHIIVRRKRWKWREARMDRDKETRADREDHLQKSVHVWSHEYGKIELHERHQPLV
jgi:hypothetical protein